MQKYTPEEYNKILDKLPQVIRETVLSREATDIIWKIGESHKLQFDKIGIMHDLIMDTMMGIVTVKNLPTELSKELDIPSVEIVPIMEEVNEKIFKPVRELMEKTFRDGAPNKLRTIATIDENDEEHLHLTKHDILREIENPVEAEVKKWTEKKEQEIKSTKEEIPEISKTTEIEEYNQELTGNKIEIKKVSSFEVLGERKKEENQNLIKPQETIVSPQKTITEMKLSGVTNVEKGAEMVKETKKEETPKPQIDPYREPAN
ncbi:MAG: hypothetical protein WCV55_02010 [Candidatus Paceibacterota bacterium]